MNTKCNETLTPIMPQTPDQVWYWSVRAVIALVGWIGNGLVIYIIGRSSRLQVISNWFILSLAVADLSVTFVVAVPEFICSVLLPDSCDWWKIKVLYDVCLYASVLNLCTMTFDRYFAIVHPLKYQRLMTTTLLYSILAASWLTAIIIPLPYYIALIKCHYEAFKTLQMLVRLLLEVMPCFLLIVTYMHMAYIARKQLRQVQQQRQQLSHNYSCCNNNIYQRPKGSVRSVGFVVLIFLLCYAVAAYKGFLNYVVFTDAPDEIIAIARMLYHLNSAANCIVYALCRKDVRCEIMKALKFKKQRKPEIQISMTGSKHAGYSKENNDQEHKKTSIVSR